MEATIAQLIFLALCTLFVLGVSVFVYVISLKRDKTWFFVYAAMLIVLVQWMSDTGASLVYHSYYFHLASVILFPSILFCLFVVYVVQGISHVRQMIFVLLLGTFGYITSIGMLHLLGNTPSYLQLDASWIRNHIFSVTAMVCDYIALLLVWPFIHSDRFSLHIIIKTFFVCWIIFVIDSLIFTFGTFWGNPALGQIISANILIRSGLALLAAPLIGFYLHIVQTQKGHVFSYRHWDDLITKEEHQMALEKSNETIDQLQKMEKQITQKNIDLEQQRMAIMNILEDVQQEKNISEALAKDLTKFKLAVDSASDHIVMTDREGVILYANHAAEEMTGYTKEEMYGKKAGSRGLWGGNMDARIYEILWHTIKGEKKSYNGEFQNKRKSGQLYIAKASVAPVLDAKGEVEFFVGIERDVTHEKEVDRMKTEFISLASHQLRTPLSAMKWFLEMLLAGDAGELNKEQKEYIGNIDQSNERMIALVNGLLNISRIESGRIIIDPQPTKLRDLVDSVVSEMKQKIEEKQLGIVVSVHSELPDIMIDPKLIRHVYMNFLTNAIKYTPKGGEITIIISRKNDEIISQISDTGVGIPKVEQSKLFQKFFRAQNVVKMETDGTGLGLYLVKAIVDSHHGKVWFASEEGKGSTFWFSLSQKGVESKKGEVSIDIGSVHSV